MDKTESVCPEVDSASETTPNKLSGRARLNGAWTESGGDEHLLAVVKQQK
jgi:hypothetical protein